jgi:hypothetical protein
MTPVTSTCDPGQCQGSLTFRDSMNRAAFDGRIASDPWRVVAGRAEEVSMGDVQTHRRRSLLGAAEVAFRRRPYTTTEAGDNASAARKGRTT